MVYIFIKHHPIGAFSSILEINEIEYLKQHYINILEIHIIKYVVMYVLNIEQTKLCEYDDINLNNIVKKYTYHIVNDNNIYEYKNIVSNHIDIIKIHLSLFTDSDIHVLLLLKANSEMIDMIYFQIYDTTRHIDLYNYKTLPQVCSKIIVLYSIGKHITHSTYNIYMIELNKLLCESNKLNHTNMFTYKSDKNMGHAIDYYKDIYHLNVFKILLMQLNKTFGYLKSKVTNLYPYNFSIIQKMVPYVPTFSLETLELWNEYGNNYDYNECNTVIDKYVFKPSNNTMESIREFTYIIDVLQKYKTDYYYRPCIMSATTDISLIVFCISEISEISNNKYIIDDSIIIYFSSYVKSNLCKTISFFEYINTILY